MITEFGKALRKLRIDLGVTLYEMAKETGVSPAFLSSIETGKRPVPDGYLEELCSKYTPAKEHLGELRVLADKTKKEVRIKLDHMDNSGSELAMAFARSFAELTEEQKRRIQSILKTKNEDS